MCGQERRNAGRCAKYVPKFKITEAAGTHCSVLAQRFADPALGELVLAYDTLGVDPQEHVHAVPGPLCHLGGVDATVQPRGQAGVPKVIWPPRAVRLGRQR